MAAGQKLRIVVCGYIVRGPLGGLAWHHLQYVLGLHRMGHDTVFVEDSDDYDACYDPRTDGLGRDPGYGLRFIQEAFDRVGIGGRWAYYDAHEDEWHGPLSSGGPGLFRDVDVLIDVSGVNPPRPWWDGAAVRVLVDTDPVFTQVRHLRDPGARARARVHDSFFTYAEAVTDGAAALPDDGFTWKPTRQPVVVDAWPVTPGPPSGPWTTVMQWDSYAEVAHEGVSYGMKSKSFAPFLDLPGRLPGVPFELAVGSPSAPRQELSRRGWGLADPLEVTRDPWTYQRYVQGSKGEFSVAKHGYVVSGSGWFSERSAGYLASGRPAVVQDTGFSRSIPTGAGLLAFSDPEEAIAALERVSSNYDFHCGAARRLAEDAFDHRLVLGRLLDDL